jgi:predicted transcriptional regulator
MALVGDIKSFKLHSLLQLITMEGKSGALKIDDGTRQAKCYFNHGKLYHCSLAKLTGANAFYELLTWDEGQFTFDERGKIDLRTVYEPLDSLLIEGSKLLEEWNVIVSGSNMKDEVYEVASMDPDTVCDFAMSPQDWKILRLVDGRLTAKQVAEKSGLGYLAVYKILFGLHTAGIIRSLQFRMLNLQIIPVPARGKSLFVPRESVEGARIGVETALQDMIFQMVDGRTNLERIMKKLQLDQKNISQAITRLHRQGLIGLIDVHGKELTLDKAAVGEHL